LRRRNRRRWSGSCGSTARSTIEQPTTFTLAINTGAAQAIGLHVPEGLLLRADLVVD
jgi:hypothetical protein